MRDLSLDGVTQYIVLHVAAVLQSTVVMSQAVNNFSCCNGIHQIILMDNTRMFIVQITWADLDLVYKSRRITTYFINIMKVV